MPRDAQRLVQGLLDRRRTNGNFKYASCKCIILNMIGLSVLILSHASGLTRALDHGRVALRHEFLTSDQVNAARDRISLSKCVRASISEFARLHRHYLSWGAPDLTLSSKARGHPMDLHSGHTARQSRSSACSPWFSGTFLVFHDREGPVKDVIVVLSLLVAHDCT
jgi:hypothetical protein